MRIARALSVMVVAAALLTACYRSDVKIDVNDDGSGTITAVFAVNPKAYADLAKQFGGASGAEGLGDDPCKSLRDDAQSGNLPSGTRVDQYHDGDFCGVKITTAFKAADDVTKSISDALGGAEAAGVGAFDAFSIQKSGNGWKFEAKPSSSGAGGAAGLDSAALRQFFQGASSVVRIKLPGRQVENNADRIDGDGTMIWNLNLFGDSRTLSARTEPGEPIRNQIKTDAGKNVPSVLGGAANASSTTGSSGGGGGSSTWLIIVIVLVVLAAIGGFFLWKRNKAHAAPAGLAGMTGMPGAPGVPVAPPAPGAPPADPGPTMPVAPITPVAPAEPTAPTAAAVPSAEGPQWDAQRNAYIQWDPAGRRWLQYDDAASEWKPIG